MRFTRPSFIRSSSVRVDPAKVSPERPGREQILAPVVKQDIVVERQQRHTFTVTKEEVGRGDHTVAVMWLMREIPEAHSLEVRYFTGDSKEMSFEFTWSTGAEDTVTRSVDIEVSEEHVVGIGTTLLCMVAESAKNLRELKLYSGLDRIDEFQLSKLMGAFSNAGHWKDTLETLEISWSCIEPGAFSMLQTYPLNLKTVKLDGCMLMDENELNTFLPCLPKLESFQVVGNSQDGDVNISSMIDI
mmetsp:Transcript_11574/g.19281  ORF Transcript_11574/g.19281 Transcript_11574/m.19281 type:complete len:244 (-) Transcript_11574:247-978(-)|eukprot:CAMPEP_0119003688 /NCGR_PEP_ID=MMETSP1176-20130426/712_1 /TAXON_ID=265551 /ORGANISM="Synedropsis recta cf, Strain CCMP1620" /LENGTH=243 /DNA_ID=CAMNT_0006955309 /DNA_START=86 /DNA_END=817 /DNA_ORIENTATION=+